MLNFQFLLNSIKHNLNSLKEILGRHNFITISQKNEYITMSRPLSDIIKKHQ